MSNKENDKKSISPKPKKKVVKKETPKKKATPKKKVVKKGEPKKKATPKKKVVDKKVVEKKVVEKKVTMIRDISPNPLKIIKPIVEVKPDPIITIKKESVKKLSFWGKIVKTCNDFFTWF